jgi:Uma2 family endonuclease
VTTVQQYHEMIRTGILTDDDPVELLDGLLVTKMRKRPAHSTATRMARGVLEQHLSPRWFVDTQEPITLEASEPEPDLIVVRGGRERYTARHPGPADVALVVEVADATPKRDRDLKQRLYAQAGIPAYWIVNLVENTVEQYTLPSGVADSPGYRERRVLRQGDAVTLMCGDEILAQIPVSELLPS